MKEYEWGKKINVNDLRMRIAQNCEKKLKRFFVLESWRYVENNNNSNQPKNNFECVGRILGNNFIKFKKIAKSMT